MELKEILSSVTDWLKFAETKNAVLVTTSGVGFWSLIRLLLNQNFSFYLELYFFSFSLFFFGSFLIGLLSFLPVLNYSIIIPRQSGRKKNILYFGYLATLSKSDLVKEYHNVSNQPGNEVSEIDSMMAEQIILNSRIALTKYKFFEYGVNSIVLGALTPIIGCVLLIVIKKRRDKIDGFG
ncbi:Pycsar system effector family protein [Marinicella sp. W31]|uniref:Pycsar system effector family protein n=1 Tax=Marinicella sp. W31 TaxID=3023713 RepID=UPI0037573E91